MDTSQLAIKLTENQHMKKHYEYLVTGLDSENRPWRLKGDITCEFHMVWHLVNKECLMELAQGKAYPNCHGPYDIQEFKIWQA